MTRGWAWWLLAAPAVLVLVLVVGGPLVGLRVSHVVSGSMSPTVGTGSLVLLHRVPVAEVEVLDVVAVSAPGGGRVMHRVVATSSAGLRLRGDANPVADPVVYDVDHADRLLAVVPGVGRLAAVPPWALLAGAAGLVLLAGVPRRRTAVAA